MTRTAVRLQLLLAAALLIGGVLALLARLAVGLSWTDAVTFALPLAVVAAPISFSAAYLCRAMPWARTPAVTLLVAVMVAAAVSGGVWAAAGYGWQMLLQSEGLDRINLPVPLVLALPAGLGGLGYLLSVTIHYMLQSMEDSAEASRRVLASEVAHRDAELRALRAQVDPHFLFNSLNSIAALTTADPGKAREMCQLLADFLRESLAVGTSPRIPLGREVALAEQYLRVEQVRFGKRLAVSTAVAPESAALAVPPLILQPLVENAVRHGIATCLDGGTIEVTARKVGDRGVIDIRNPRDGEGGRPGTGRGLDLVRRRLIATYGSRASMSVESTPAGFGVTLTLPAEEVTA